MKCWIFPTVFSRNCIFTLIPYWNIEVASQPLLQNFLFSINNMEVDVLLMVFGLCVWERLFDTLCEMRHIQAWQTLPVNLAMFTRKKSFMPPSSNEQSRFFWFCPSVKRIAQLEVRIGWYAIMQTSNAPARSANTTSAVNRYWLYIVGSLFKVACKSP